MEVVLCIPGRTWTHGFGMSMLALVQACNNRKVTLQVFPPETTADLYMNRNLSVCPTAMKDEQGKVARVEYPAKAKDWRPFNGKMKPDRVFWIDTDMVFKPEDFFRLIDHDEDFVSGCCMSGPNDLALGYYSKLPSGEEYLSNLPRFKVVPGKGYIDSFKAWAEDGPTEKGLRLVDYVGMAFVCTKLSVYERLEYPYFRTTMFQHGDMEIQTSEDLGFCRRVRDAGIDIYADPKVTIGHQKTIELVVHP